MPRGSLLRRSCIIGSPTIAWFAGLAPAYEPDCAMTRIDPQPQRVWSPALAHTVARPLIAVVMGVSGSGKSTVAALLAGALGCHFQEGDLLHPRENVKDAQRDASDRCRPPALAP